MGAKSSDFVVCSRRPHEPCRPGTILSERYRLVRLLSAKNGSVLWLADVKVGRRGGMSEVALRIFDAPVDIDASTHNRFQTEVRMLQCLHGDHAPRIDESGFVEGMPFVASQFLRGRTLAERMADGLLLTPFEARHVALQALHALSEANSLGKHHGNIRPSNIFWCESPTLQLSETCVKVIDWNVGEYFRPPFQRTATQRGDIFALGATLKRAMGDNIQRCGELRLAIEELMEPLSANRPSPVSALLRFAEVQTSEVLREI